MKQIIAFLIFVALFSLPTMAQDDTTAIPTDNSAATELTGMQIIERYIDAIGGRENLEKIKYLTVKTLITVQGDAVEIHGLVYRKAPNKFSMTMRSSNGSMVQQQVFNGKKGFASVGQSVVELDGDDLLHLKWEAPMNPELHYIELGYLVTMMGTDSINGEFVYKVEVVSPDKTVENHYFSKKTGLRIRTVEARATPSETILYVVDYSNYMEINGGVKYPMAMRQTVGSQIIDVLVTSIDNSGRISNGVFIIEN